MQSQKPQVQGPNEPADLLPASVRGRDVRDLLVGEGAISPMKPITRALLEKRRDVVIADARMKLDVGDYHGCADACMDLREIEAQLVMLDSLRAAGELARV